MRLSRTAALIGATALTVTLGACGATEDTATGGAESSATASASAEAQADRLTVTDPWVKAADKGMTSMFGTLTNDGSSDIGLVSASSTAAESAQLHETEQGADGSTTMQQMDGGLTIPAGATHELSPGGDHVMLMGLTEPLQPGATVRVKLTFEDGSSTRVDAVVKDFAGADENYSGGEDDSDMGEMDGMKDMDHGDMDHGDMDHGE